jgi:hypothetical protein
MIRVPLFAKILFESTKVTKFFDFAKRVLQFNDLKDKDCNLEKCKV